MTGHAPTITIITPNYNHAHLLGDCLASIADQNCSVLEHIVVDDASTDNSRKVLNELAKRYPRVRVLFQERNQGPAQAVLRGMREARGDFVLALAADDVLVERAIERFTAVIKAHPDAAFVCGEVEYRTGNKRWHRRYITADQPVYLSPDELVQYSRSMLSVVNGAAIARRELVMNSAICDLALAWHGDMFAYTTIAYRYGVWYIPEIVHRFTVGDTNLSKKATVWKLEKPVLASLFGLLNSPDYADVRKRFRDSASLAELPLIMRYVLTNPGTWYYLTFRLLRNASTLQLYRALRRHVPQAWIDAYIDYKSRRTSFSTAQSVPRSGLS